MKSQLWWWLTGVAGLTSWHGVAALLHSPVHTRSQVKRYIPSTLYQDQHAVKPWCHIHQQQATRRYATVSTSSGTITESFPSLSSASSLSSSSSIPQPSRWKFWKSWMSRRPAFSKKKMIHVAALLMTTLLVRPLQAMAGGGMSMASSGEPLPPLGR